MKELKLNGLEIKNYSGWFSVSDLKNTVPNYDGRIADIMQTDLFAERLYYLLMESSDAFQENKDEFLYNMKVNASNYLKGLGIYKTVGRGKNKASFAKLEVFATICFQYHPKVYADFLVWLYGGGTTNTEGNNVMHSKPTYKTYLMYDKNTMLTKIGKSKDPKVREKTLQGEKPTVHIIAVCDKDVEQYLHNEYAEYRVRGEWFDLIGKQYEGIVRNFGFKEISN